MKIFFQDFWRRECEVSGMESISKKWYQWKVWKLCLILAAVPLDSSYGPKNKIYLGQSSRHFMIKYLMDPESSQIILPFTIGEKQRQIVSGTVVEVLITILAVSFLKILTYGCLWVSYIQLCQSLIFDRSIFEFFFLRIILLFCSTQLTWKKATTQILLLFGLISYSRAAASRMSQNSHWMELQSTRFVNSKKNFQNFSNFSDKFPRTKPLRKEDDSRFRPFSEVFLSKRAFLSMQNPSM